MFLAKDVLLSDAGYSAWSNQRLLEGCSSLAPGLLTRDLAASHSSILKTLCHIYAAEKVWLECLTSPLDDGAWRLPTDPEPQFSAAELLQIWPNIWSGYQTWLRNASDPALEFEVILHLPNQMSPSIARWKILQHVLDHSTFHRGQIVSMIRSLEQLPPAINRMDYVLATEEVRAR